MGEVFRAQDRLSGQVVALKRVRKLRPNPKRHGEVIQVTVGPYFQPFDHPSFLNEAHFFIELDRVGIRRPHAQLDPLDLGIGSGPVNQMG